MPTRQYPAADTKEQIAANLHAVMARIAATCERCGRDPASVRLLPVTKTVSEEKLRLAFAAGCHDMGENKVQEVRRKSEIMADLPIRWAVIGHLQTNKAKYVAQLANEFHALDSLRLAEKLNNRLAQEGRTLDVLVQVNSSGEESKFGLTPAEVPAFVKELSVYPNLRVKGLMTLAIFSDDAPKVRACFVRMRELQATLKADAEEGQSFDVLSMGMSGDFEMAIEEGATCVRVGQAIFGPRPLPDSHYWPGK